MLKSYVHVYTAFHDETDEIIFNFDRITPELVWMRQRQSAISGRLE